MDAIDLLVDLHGSGERQGPGSRAATLQALALSGARGRSGLRVADLGCGTGASTLVLAEALADELGAPIDAVDLMPDLLACLRERAATAGLGERIRTLEASIDALPFDHGSLDLIWSEGAIYNIGFEAGIRGWRPYLRAGGVLAVSELTWLSDTRPAALDAHWQSQYPGVATAGEKMRQLERAGYEPRGYFPLNPSCWKTHFYEPLAARFDDFLARHGHSEQARAIVDAEAAESALYSQYGAYVSYGFYVAARAHD